MNVVSLDSPRPQYDKNEKRHIFDPLCIDLGKEYYKSWNVPKRPSAEEIEKRKPEWEKFLKERKRY
jgi:hypothetical protein